MYVCMSRIPIYIYSDLEGTKPPGGQDRTSWSIRVSELHSVCMYIKSTYASNAWI